MTPDQRLIEKLEAENKSLKDQLNTRVRANFQLQQLVEKCSQPEFTGITQRRPGDCKYYVIRHAGNSDCDYLNLSFQKIVQVCPCATWKAKAK